MADSYVLFDTDILIDISRNIESAIQFIEDYKLNYILGISVITQLELMSGCENKEEFNHLSDFIERFEVFNISEAISGKTVELFQLYRLSHGVKIPDMLIASTAIVYQIPLISKNRKDFSFIEELEFIPYVSN